MKLNIYVLSTLFIGLLYACKTTPDEVTVIRSTDTLALTMAQVQLAGIELGSIEKRTLRQTIKANGRIETPANARAKVMVPFAGYVKKVWVHNGEDVVKGQPLVSLAHPLYIELQQQYIEAGAELEYAGQELKRQQNLFDSRAGAAKELELAKTAFDHAKIKKESLAMQLKMLGIQIEQLEAGALQESIRLTSPVNGKVNELMISVGELVSSDKSMMEVFSNDVFCIELHVFEKNINNVRIGQRVLLECTVANTDHLTHEAEITSVGNYINPETNTFLVHAKPSGNYVGLRHGLFVNGEIELSSELLPAVYEEDLTVTDKGVAVFEALNDSTFVLRYIEVSEESFDGYYHLLSAELEGLPIAVKGVNYLKAQLLADE